MQETDILVVGAGPAGTVTAALLQRLGCTVEVWERLRFPRFRIGESLPPRTIGLLRHLGFDSATSTRHFAVMEGHTSLWGSGEPRRAVFPEGFGLQVERSLFDQLLAEQSAARIHFGRDTTQLIREGGAIVGARFRGPDSEGEQRFRFVIVAGGGGSGRRLARDPKVDLHQVAVYAYWAGSNFPEGSQANDTVIEALPDGWVWSLRLASGLRNVTLVCGEASAGEIAAGRDGFYQKAVDSTTFVRRALSGARMSTPVETCGASWLRSESYGEPGMLLVGDAATTVDPLSSQGVYKALCSAVTAAAVANTCLKSPKLSGVSLNYFDEEEKRAYDGYAAGSIATFRAEQRWPDRPFWRQRHALSAWDHLVHPAEPSPVISELARSIETGRANDLMLATADGVRVEKRAFIEGSLIAVADCVVTDRTPQGYKGPHAAVIADLAGQFKGGRTIGKVLEAAASSRLLPIVAYMCREGLIRRGSASL